MTNFLSLFNLRNLYNYMDFKFSFSLINFFIQWFVYLFIKNKGLYFSKLLYNYNDLYKLLKKKYINIYKYKNNIHIYSLINSATKISILPLSFEYINMNILLEFISSNIDYIFYISFILPSYIIYKNINKIKDIYLEEKKDNYIKVQKGFIRIKGIFLFFILLLLLFFIYSDIYLKESNFEYLRILKLLLNIIVNFCSIYITYKINGLKSRKMLFNIFSLFFILIYFFLLFNDNWKIIIFTKLRDSLLVFSLLFSGMFSIWYDYLWIYGNNEIIFKGGSLDREESNKWNEVSYMVDSSNCDINKIRSESGETIKEEFNKDTNEEENRKYLRSPWDPEEDNGSIRTIDSGRSDISNAYFSVFSDIKRRVKEIRDISELCYYKLFKFPGKSLKELEEVIYFPPQEKITAIENGMKKEEKLNKYHYSLKRKLPRVIDDNTLYERADKFKEKLEKDSVKREKFWEKLTTFLNKTSKVKNLHLSNPHDYWKVRTLEWMKKEDYIPKDYEKVHITNKAGYEDRLKSLNSWLEINDVNYMAARNQDFPWKRRPKIKRSMMVTGKLSIFDYLEKCSREEVELFNIDKEKRLKYLERIRRDFILREESSKNWKWERNLYHNQLREDLIRIQMDRQKEYERARNVNNWLPR